MHVWAQSLWMHSLLIPPTVPIKADCGHETKQIIELELDTTVSSELLRCQFYLFGVVLPLDDLLG
jgi:hypothetical protein